MADFLSQSEIDALLDIVDDDTSTEIINNCIAASIECLDYASDDEIVTVAIGEKGYILRKFSSFSNSVSPEYIEIVDIENDMVTVVGEDSDEYLIKLSRLEQAFYKNLDRFNALKIKKQFDSITNIIDPYDLNEFIELVQKYKTDYPEIWI